MCFPLTFRTVDNELHPFFMIMSVATLSARLKQVFWLYLYSSPLNNPLCLSIDNMVDQIKVEASEAKANELEKKVTNVLIHKEHDAV